MNIVEYADREMMMIDLANRLAEEIKEAVMVQGAASFVVPGGSTPGPIFDALCGADLDWDKVTVIPSDERWVDESSEHSNARLIKQRLLVEKARSARFLPLYEPGEGVDAVAALSAKVAQHLPISVLLLGMGSDMHTASLFPGQAGVRPEHRHAKDAHLLFVKTPGLDPKLSRMTLTVPALTSAHRTHVVITGTQKRAALEEAHRLNDPFQAPIAAVLSGALIHWAE